MAKRVFRPVCGARFKPGILFAGFVGVKKMDRQYYRE